MPALVLRMWNLSVTVMCLHFFIEETNKMLFSSLFTTFDEDYSESKRYLNLYLNPVSLIYLIVVYWV